jgi:PAS domain S-box-containing protein/diguanylate cyclase (GGDEF)-like protein
LFSAAWDSYDNTKDDMIALALQGRFSESGAIERATGSTGFDAASGALRKVKEQLQESSASKVESVLHALKQACVETTGLAVAIAAFMVTLLVVETKRQRLTLRLVEAAQTLRESESRFRSAFEQAAVGMIVCDLDGIIISVNRAIEEIILFRSHELVGQQVRDFMPEADKLDSVRRFDLLLAGEVQTYRAERQFIRKDGVTAWIRTSVALVRRQGAPRDVIALCEDITDQKRAEQRLTYLASHDVLTGLANRHHFEESLEQMLQDAARNNRQTALLYLDLDGFKRVNDTMGHLAGDAVLGEVGSRLNGAVDGFLLARAGGDEFVLAMPVSAAEGRAGVRPEGEVARTLLRTLGQPFRVEGQELHIGVSIGISSFQQMERRRQRFSETPIQPCTAPSVTGRDTASTTLRCMHPRYAGWRSRTSFGARSSGMNCL